MGKRGRGENYSVYEKELLVTLVAERPVLLDKDTKKFKVEAKERAWAEIVRNFNEDPRTRHVNDWKKLRSLHKNLKARAAKEVRALRESMTTGDGPYHDINISGVSEDDCVILVAVPSENTSPNESDLPSQSDATGKDDSLCSETNLPDSKAQKEQLCPISLGGTQHTSSKNTGQSASKALSQPLIPELVEGADAEISPTNQELPGIQANDFAPPNKKRKANFIALEAEKRFELYELQKLMLQKKIMLLDKKIQISNLTLRAAQETKQGEKQTEV